MKGGVSSFKGKTHSIEAKKKIGLAGIGKHVGEKSGSWKGGKTFHKSGYVYISNPNHPFKNPNNYVFEHRLIMEKHLGRFLKPEEVVHHINGIKDDNRIENLSLFATLAEHSRHHSKFRKRKVNKFA